VEYEDQAYSDSVAKVVSGEYATQQTVADAAGLLCDGGTSRQLPEVLNVATKTMADGIQQMATVSTSTGSGSACGIMASHQAALSLAMASAQVLANAFTVNFNKSCGAAAVAAVTGLAKSSDVAVWLVDRMKISCSTGGQERNMVTCQ